MNEEKVEGLSVRQFLAKVTRRGPKERPQDRFFSTKLRKIQQAKAQIPAMFNILDDQTVFDLLVQTFYNRGLKPIDFQVLAKKLKQKIEEEQKKKEQRRKEAQRQQQLQKELFYRFGLAIAYGAHRPKRNSTAEKFLKEIQSFSREQKVAILKRLREGEIPLPLRAHNYDERDIQQAMNWLTTEILATENV